MSKTPPPDRAAPALDSDVTAWLDAALAEPPHAAAGDAQATGADDATSRERVRRRLLRRVAADSTPRHGTVHAAEGAWQPFGPGVRMKVLHEAGGVMSYLLRLEAGARVAAHRHPIDEECVVLEGRLCIGDLVLEPGCYHLGRQGVLHDRLHSPEGALIFLRGAVPEPELVI
jgi:quercetin dioxygenase-like cupin family protein